MSTNAKVKVEESALEKAMRLCKEVDEEEERERLKEEEVKRKEEAEKKRRDEVEKYNKPVMREAKENRKKELKTKEEEALRLKEAKDKEEAILLPASLSRRDEAEGCQKLTVESPVRQNPSVLPPV